VSTGRLGASDKGIGAALLTATSTLVARADTSLYCMFDVNFGILIFSLIS